MTMELQSFSHELAVDLPSLANLSRIAGLEYRTICVPYGFNILRSLFCRWVGYAHSSILVLLFLHDLPVRSLHSAADRFSLHILFL